MRSHSHPIYRTLARTLVAAAAASTLLTACDKNPGRPDTPMPPSPTTPTPRTPSTIV